MKTEFCIFCSLTLLYLLLPAITGAVWYSRNYGPDTGMLLKGAVLGACTGFVALQYAKAKSKLQEYASQHLQEKLQS